MNGNETVHGAAVVSGTHVTIAQKKTQPDEPSQGWDSDDGLANV